MISLCSLWGSFDNTQVYYEDNDYKKIREYKDAG
jgi:hypothetical protein